MSKKYAPRLMSRKVRARSSSRLPSEIKEYIHWYAKKNGCSMSWVMEQMVIDYFDLVVPRYIDNKEQRRNFKKVIHEMKFISRRA